MRDKVLLAANTLIVDYRNRILAAVRAGNLPDATKYDSMVQGMILLREQLEIRLKEEE